MNVCNAWNFQDSGDLFVMPHLRTGIAILTLLALATGCIALAANDSNPDPRLVVVKDKAGNLIAPSNMEGMLDNANQAGEPLRYTVMLRTASDYDPFRIGADAAFEAEYRNRSTNDINLLSFELATRAVGSVKVVARLLPLPIIVVEADEAGLRALIESPLVAGVYGELIMRPFLHETLPLIEVASLDAVALGGVGQTVAVLDTGVQLNHPMFTGKIVGQACFASGNPGYPACPPGHSSPSILPGSGETCVGSPECEHGTHVSAIAVGLQRLTPLGPVIRGVASSASLVPVRVASLTSDCEDPESSPCIEHKLTDTHEALAWIFSNRDSLGISAVNISYGRYSSSFSIECGYYDPAIAHQIAMLSGAGVAVVAASGNRGTWPSLRASIAFPACVEHVVAVGAVDKGGSFASYSNAGQELDILAPGGIGNPDSGVCSPPHQCVLSATTGSAYKYDLGTSMAAPHVAAAIAALRNIWPKSEVSVEVVLDRLRVAGAPTIVDQFEVRFDTPQLKLQAAIAPESLPVAIEPILMLILGD